MTNPAQRMKAAFVETNDGPFRLAEVARPTVNAGEILVRIHASGVNPLDAKIRAGAAAHARHPLPAVLGLDLAGVVEAVAADVTAFRPGDEVYGMIGGVGGIQGTLAEYASVDASLLAIKPANLTMREAAALPLVTITAWEGLVDRAKVRSGQTLLVQGGAGGVGHVAVQIGLALGATVFATDRAAKADFIRSMGATPIDYASESIEDYVGRHTGGAGFDLVYDTGGGAILDASFQAVKRFGHVVSSLGWGTHALAPLSFKAGTYSGVFTLAPLLDGVGRAHHGEILKAAAALVEAGKLVPRLDPRVFSFDTVTEAHAAISDRTAAGKIVVSIVEA
ncbi:MULTISPECIES: zinc-dependent alcohol dehydrogenase family protein [Rhizobium/Agrobacterium group]|jgi:NADPH2:quinone reductase|uniref:Zinc-dependent alcohol dehydrogenase family protein n=2 Tax=Neorhizobium TaxID=1525371 RepID=A0ABV0M6D1_9HYPH|nr:MULTISPECIES: zinc-dependent alcohol dehydrogenase family protein [Rhizobium/Agrobacterium group]KGD87275.1 quinone oxidoreductase [Rhizobium sp. YS-1r]MCC2612679.1 zinc-dependent alcohol dehydrogenase family protein [Neorhizobium petrolearium]WGI67801.1 zinc-dependent alcohol dehydrogenase family protein [Neorhizobium petrolearium]